MDLWAWRDSPGGVYLLFTTSVAPGHEGEGVGSKLVRGVLERLQAEKPPLTVIPTCPFVRSYLQRHPEYGYELIRKAEGRVGVRDDQILAMAKDIVYTHHERWDGTGYPRRLRGKEIPVEGRVMAVVDVYDATTTRTLYRPSMSHDDAVKFIVQRSATHFDPAVVEAFVEVASSFKTVSAEAD